MLRLANQTVKRIGALATSTTNAPSSLKRAHSPDDKDEYTLDEQPPTKRAAGTNACAVAYPKVEKYVGTSKATYVPCQGPGTVMTTAKSETAYQRPSSARPDFRLRQDNNILREQLHDIDESKNKELRAGEDQLKDAEMQRISDVSEKKLLQIRLDAAEKALADERSKTKPSAFHDDKSGDPRAQVVASTSMFEARKAAIDRQLASDRAVVVEYLDIHKIPNEDDPHRPSLHGIYREVQLLAGEIDRKNQHIDDERKTHQAAINKKDDEIKDVVEQSQKLNSEIQASHAELTTSKNDLEFARTQAIVLGGKHDVKANRLEQEVSRRNFQLQISEAQRIDLENERDEVKRKCKVAADEATDLAKQLEKAKEAIALLADREAKLEHFKQRCSHLEFALKSYGAKIPKDDSTHTDNKTGVDQTGSSEEEVEDMDDVQNHKHVDRDSALGSSVNSSASSFTTSPPAIARFELPSTAPTSLGQPSWNYAPQSPQIDVPSHGSFDSMDTTDASPTTRDSSPMMQDYLNGESDDEMPDPPNGDAPTTQGDLDDSLDYIINGRSMGSLTQNGRRGHQGRRGAAPSNDMRRSRDPAHDHDQRSSGGVRRTEGSGGIPRIPTAPRHLRAPGANRTGSRTPPADRPFPSIEDQGHHHRGPASRGHNRVGRPTAPRRGGGGSDNPNLAPVGNSRGKSGWPRGHRGAGQRQR